MPGLQGADKRNGGTLRQSGAQPVEFLPQPIPQTAVAQEQMEPEHRVTGLPQSVQNGLTAPIHAGRLLRQLAEHFRPVFPLALAQRTAGRHPGGEAAFAFPETDIFRRERVGLDGPHQLRGPHAQAEALLPLLAVRMSEP